MSFGKSQHKIGLYKYDDESYSVGFTQNSGADIPTEGGVNGFAKAPAFISLGHELAHAEDHLKGTLNKNQTWVGTVSNYIEAEKYATYRENQFRRESGVPLRTHYGVLRGPSGILIPDNLTKIIDSKGNNLFYKSKK